MYYNAHIHKKSWVRASSVHSDDPSKDQNNVWIRQPLYTATIWDVELKDWNYEPIITKSDEVNMFEVKLQPVPPEDLREEILSNATEVNQETNDTSGKSASNEKDEKPSFGVRPNTKNPDFDLKKELERLPFELNIGDTLLTCKQQAVSHRRDLRSYGSFFTI